MLWQILIHYTRPYRWRMLATVLLQLVSVFAMLYLPSLNAKIIDDGIAVGDTDYIWRTGGLMLGITGLQVFTAIAAVWFGALASMSLGRDLRAGVFRTVSKLSTNQIHHFGPATLITRGTNDVQQIQMLVLAGLEFLLIAPLMTIGGTVMALREDAGLSWLLWVTIPLLVIFAAVVLRKLIPYFQANQLAIDEINGVLREQIIGVRVVRAFVREGFESQRFEKANKKLADLSLRIGRLFAFMFPSIFMLLHVATAAVMWFGAFRVESGEVMVGSLIAFMQYLLQILMGVMMAMFIFMILPRAMISARRITEVLDTEPELLTASEDPTANNVTAKDITDGVDVVSSSTTAELRFNDVSFQYPGAESPILQHINFTARPGTSTAIIGGTGSGKTTLLNLIPRLQDVTDGSVTLNEADVRGLTRETLSTKIAMVPQKAFLFSGTVASNLRFGAPDATDEELWEALRIAQAAEFVEARGGLESSIAQGGTDVSGGQRQRLCIARALVVKPKIFLFDDSFSALDVATDARLRTALADATAETNTAMITVAQRVATICEADNILVLDNGKIVGSGTHEQLLQACGVYQEIVNSQKSAEELP